MPLCENMRSTGAEVTGTQYTLKKTGRRPWKRCDEAGGGEFWGIFDVFFDICVFIPWRTAH